MTPHIQPDKIAIFLFLPKSCTCILYAFFGLVIAAAIAGSTEFLVDLDQRIEMEPIAIPAFQFLNMPDLEVSFASQLFSFIYTCIKSILSIF